MTETFPLAQAWGLHRRSQLGFSTPFTASKADTFQKEQLAKEAIYLERVLCGESGGWQDQIAASFGGLNRIDFANNSFVVRPIVMPNERKRRLERNLLLFFTGFTRFSSEMQDRNKITQSKMQLTEMLALVDKAQEVLTDKDTDLSRFGDLLDESWRLKRKTSKGISTGSIDELYARGIAAGASGGKLLGAGGGGFLLFCAEPDAQQFVRAELSELLEIPFAFESVGTTVAYFEPEDYEPAERVSQ